PAISACRRTEPAKLGRVIRGELDWIVMKALEKDRTRRYETANGLARDLEHYLTDEPVEACPPTTAYRLKKLARKHKKALFTSSAIALILVLAAAASMFLAMRARQAREEALEAERSARKAASRANAVLTFLQD